MMSTGAVARDCGDVSDSPGGRFSFVAVPDLDSKLMGPAADAAALLLASANRQKALLAKLQQVLPALGSCSMMASSLRNSSRLTGTASFASLGHQAAHSYARAGADVASRAIAEIYPALGVDMDSVEAVLRASLNALASARKQAAVAA